MAKDDPEELKVIKNTIFAELWEINEKSGVPETLYARREHYDAEVPTGVLVLTMGIDTQDNRLEYEVVGWNRHEESWGISRGVIPGRPDSPGVWAEVDALLDKEWQMANGMKMRILATFIDSGGHFTETIYKECAKRMNRRIWPIKGEGGEKPYVRPMKKAAKGEGMKFLIGVDHGKEQIMYASGIDTPGPKYMHFPIDYRCGYDEEYFRGLISERQVIHRRGGRATVAWEVTHERNEPLDLRNYNRAAYCYFNWRFDDIERMLAGEEKPPITRAEQQKKNKKKRTAMISGGIKV